MAWAVEFDEDAERDLKKLNRQTAERVLRFLSERLAVRDDPRSLGEVLKGSANIWRYRVGDYRILCSIEDAARRVWVLEVGHRREVYR